LREREREREREKEREFNDTSENIDLKQVIRLENTIIRFRTGRLSSSIKRKIREEIKTKSTHESANERAFQKIVLEIAKSRRAAIPVSMMRLSNFIFKRRILKTLRERKRERKRERERIAGEINIL
jgi:hypothetical protein